LSPLRHFLKQAAASLVILIGLAVLNCGPRVQAGFVSLGTSVSLLPGAAAGDFLLGKSPSSAAADVPSSPPEHLPLPGFRLAGLGGGAGRPASGSSGGSPTSPHELAEQISVGGPAPPLPTGYIRARQVRPFPDPSLSSIFHPPRVA
jgi:hypothetical protein